MIINFTVENYLSIKNKVLFNLEASGSNKLSRNIIRLEDRKLLRNIAIYGANASGKSNLIKSLFFMWKMVVHSHKFNIGDKIPCIPFKLDTESYKKPSKFEITFIQDNIKYKYGFSCNEKEFVEEYLYYWPKGKESLIFKREKGNKFIFKNWKKQQKIISEQTIPNTLYLSRATQLGLEITKPIFQFFVENLVITTGGPPAWHEYTVNSIHENKKLKEKIIDVLKRTDFGGIDDISVKKEKGKVQEIKFDLQSSGVSQRELENYILNVKFIHRIKGKDISLNYGEESLGTQKTFSMLGPIFDILEKGKVAIIDEIDSSLHPKIALFLVQLFNSRHNKKNAQLIFTTHNPSLLRNDLFRKDQFYFCEKEPNKSTKITLLKDYDIRQETDFEKAYLEGRLGANPFIDETYLE